MTTLTIASRYKGPPESGNGGYVCGLIATSLQVDIRVRLVAPPPLETPLELAPDGEGQWVLSSAAGPVARAVAGRCDVLEVGGPHAHVGAIAAPLGRGPCGPGGHTDSTVRRR